MRQPLGVGRMSSRPAAMGSEVPAPFRKLPLPQSRPDRAARVAFPLRRAIWVRKDAKIAAYVWEARGIGRGREPTWLAQLIAAGRKKEEFLIKDPDLIEQARMEHGEAA